MKHVSNEEKARKIVEYYETRYNDTRDLLWYDLEDIARQAMEWKDEQFLQWLKENLAEETFTMFTPESQGVINFNSVIKAFEKFIKQ